MRRHSSPNSDSNNKPTGSPPEGEPVFLAVGKLRRPHGIQGEVSMEIITDFPERLKAGQILYVGEAHQPLTLESVRPHDQLLLLSFTGFNDPDSIGQFRNQFLYVQAKSVPPLPEGYYYHHQLMDMAVVDTEGQLLGIMTDILETGANDIYVVTTPEGGELLLPVIENVILDINLEKREIRASPPVWL
jgi:16S rRNA processing protein RimM